MAPILPPAVAGISRTVAIDLRSREPSRPSARRARLPDAMATDDGPVFRIGVDIGGTFTDFVVQDAARGSVIGLKILTTPDDPSRAVFEGLRMLAADFGIAPQQTAVVVHATTLATNTLLERKGAKVGLITTAGLRDVLEMRRETRYDDYDLAIEFPPPLIPRKLRIGVGERMKADGGVARALDERTLRAAIRTLAAEKVDAIAICFLHAYANPAHERRAAALVRRALPQIPLSVSSSVQPEIREFERFCTTVANAYIQPTVRRYVARLTDGLRAGGYTAPLRIMQSNGGFAGPRQSGEFPVRMIESGPAAGAIAAAAYGRASGERDLLGFDMGGTTAKIAVLRDCIPRIATELEVARVHRFKKGSGYPIKCPSVELIEIGAGGGSLAVVDALGRVRVGPQSAGADPGPVCYGRGGAQPTVTDADLVLGYLDPAYFAGGRMRLDLRAAQAAIAARIAKPTRLTLVRAAWGIHDIVNESMATAARLHLLERGEDPRRFTLVAFGGAGPVHAHRIAAKLGIRRILYPIGAGIASAHGLMIAPMSVDLVRTYVAALEHVDWRRFGRAFEAMEKEAHRSIAAEAGGALRFERIVDMRYRGQGFEIQVAIPGGSYSAAGRDVIRLAFIREYARIFGREVSDVPVEIVNLRLFARGPVPAAPIGAHPAHAASGVADKGTRAVFFGECGDFVGCRVYDRRALAREAEIEGPALVEEAETTVVLGPGQRGRIDQAWNLIVDLPDTKRGSVG